MKKIIFICLFLITSGCSIFQPEEKSLIQPKLLKQVELPPLRESTYANYFEFYCEMQINTNGDVERAKLLAGTGDAVWDSLAVLSLLEWKYTPAIYDGHPIKLVVHKKIRVVFTEPKIFSLSEIQLDNREDADSVYQALLNGADFNSLVIIYSTSRSKLNNGFIGNVNIKYYSEEISVELNRLRVGEFTKPLKFGDHYIIFKRVLLNN